MRFLFLLMLFAGPAWAGTAYFNSALDLTGTAPVQPATPCYLGSACPLSLYTAQSARVTVCAETPGATLGGAGEIRFWLYVPPPLAAWSLNPLLSMPIPVQAAGQACYHYGFTIDVGSGWLLPVANGVTVSAGTQVRVQINLLWRTP